MERVETLSKMLAEKIENKAAYDDILVTVKMIESELKHLITIQPPQKGEDKPTTSINIFKQTQSEPTSDSYNEEKTVEILQVDEKEVEAEIEEIKHNLSHLSFIGNKNKPAFAIEDEKEINDIHKDFLGNEINNALAEKANELNDNITPEKNIVAHNLDVAETKKEINEISFTENIVSINDKLSVPINEISDSLKDAPIADLKKAIGVNERFLYLNELFRGDDIMYDKSIKTINSFTNYGEAELWIRRELKLRLGWDDNYTTVKQFYALVIRRFS